MEVHKVSYIIALLDCEQRMMHRILGQTQLAEKITRAVLGLPEQEPMEGPWQQTGAQWTTDKLAPGILVM